ncbi:hypothetical protein BVY03_04120 [bacterium K02(2017)]|nr:hypothetical protein BVY03_04120 [bacterium K02(2017)]
MPKTTLICSFDICAAHQLYNKNWDAQKNIKIFGKCANIHGHQYKLEAFLSGSIDQDTGMLINGYEVERIIGTFLKEKFDHKFLNEDVEFFKTHQPTAEWIAAWVYNQIKDMFPENINLDKVRLYETPELAVEYVD